MPANSAMNKDRPIPTGAMKVALCFSAASMKIVKTSWAVRNISMKRPWVTVVPCDNDVCTFSVPGNNGLLIAAAAMAPSICDMKSKIPLTYGNAPTRHIPSVTAGLPRPPLILKKAHALTAKEKPKHRLI